MVLLLFSTLKISNYFRDYKKSEKSLVLLAEFYTFA